MEGVCTPGPVAPAPTRPADVSGEPVHIKDVSADNAMAVMEETVPFMQVKKIIYRDVVLHINYCYNACKGVLDSLIERGHAGSWISRTRNL